MYSSSIIRMSLCAFTCVAISITSAMGATEKSYESLFDQARDLRISGHYEDAILTYGEAIKLKPDDSAVNIELATLLRDTGDVDAAQRLLKTAIDNKINSADLHLLYGELVETTDEKMAREQYQAAINADPASQAAVNALGNLESMDGIVRDDIYAGLRADIEWSIPKDDGHINIDDLANQIDGEWCLELVDIYHHERGLCVSNPLAGDLAVIDGFPRVQLRIDSQNRRLISSELGQVTELAVPESPIANVEIETGHHYKVHTLNFEGDRRFNFDINNGGSQCFRVQQFDRDQELSNCTNAYTFCQCSR